MKKPPNPHHRHRFPADLISHAVWLYHVFSLSLRDVGKHPPSTAVLIAADWRGAQAA